MSTLCQQKKSEPSRHVHATSEGVLWWLHQDINPLGSFGSIDCEVKLLMQRLIGVDAI